MVELKLRFFKIGRPKLNIEYNKRPKLCLSSFN